MLHAAGTACSGLDNEQTACGKRWCSVLRNRATGWRALRSIAARNRVLQGRRDQPTIAGRNFVQGATAHRALFIPIVDKGGLDAHDRRVSALTRHTPRLEADQCTVPPGPDQRRTWRGPICSAMTT